MNDQGLTAKSVSRKISSIKSLFNYLSGRFEINNCSTSLTFPKLEQTLPLYLTENEVRKLLEGANRDNSNRGVRNKVMLYLLYASGMRVSELVNLVVDQIQDKLSEFNDTISDLAAKIEDVTHNINWDINTNNMSNKLQKVDASTIRVRFADEDCWLVIAEYLNSRTSIQLMSEAGPVATATVNLSDEKIEPDDVIIKNYSENKGILSVLVTAGVVLNPHRTIQLDNNLEAYVCKLNLKL